ncbi:MAG: hypothetical protein PHZ07_02725 [Patescibacteria group bacterium]|nr:hypothetical protein [Patescibacteria group bacterium]
MATTKTSEYYMGITIGIVGLVCLVVFLYIVFLLICKANSCSQRIPFRPGEKLELRMSSYFLGNYVFKFEVLITTKNQFTMLCEIFSEIEDKKNKYVDKIELKGDISTPIEKTINIPFLSKLSIGYDENSNSLEVSIERIISFCDETVQNQTI